MVSNDTTEIRVEPIPGGQVDFWILLSSLVLFVLWVSFLTLYFSRIVALFVSFALNRFLRLNKNQGYIKVGSFSVSLLAGKAMFRDLIYVNNDFSIRINDGWMIFSYWRKIPSKELQYTDNNTDAPSRLHVSLNGFQLHWYNRVDRFKEIAQLFGLERCFPGEELKRPPSIPTNVEPLNKFQDRLWALFGIIRLDIWSGRTVIGNKLLPYMFVLSWENMQSSKVKLCKSTKDRALFSVEGALESLNCSFQKHPEYNGEAYKDPPRTMGDGFAILQSAHLKFYYHQDILGYVTSEVQTTEKEDRPLWESIWQFGPNTVVSYGPWAEQQRALIWKFFFPADYQTLSVTELPKKGQRRVQIMHDVRVSLFNQSSIDLWFMRGDQLESIHNHCQQGSTIDMSIWWIINEGGFSSTANISLLNVVSTSSLLYRKLFECETLRIDSLFQYPRVFNAKQEWSFSYKITKATMWFVWDHKRFFTDLINEWVGDLPADLLDFIPFQVNTDLSVTDGFEIIMILNGGNWVDSSEMQSENVEAAIVGEKLSFTNVMSFLDFLPETHSMQFGITGENQMAMRMKHPANSATAPLLAMLTRAAHHNPNAAPSVFGTYSKQKGLEKDTKLWHECWRTERVSMAFNYTFHPYVPPAKTDIPFHVLQDWVPKKAEYPKDLKSDTLGVFIELEGSEVQITGLLIRFILDLKNNYFGFYDSLTDIQQVEKTYNSKYSKEKPQIQGMFNRVPRNALVESYRPMDVQVELRIHNIRGHFLLHSMHGGLSEPEPCPVLYTEELVLEMKKSYEEMILQVVVGQCAVHFEGASIYQSDGFLSLSGLQFRGQALLSPLDVPWDMAVIEYSWQMEILVGELRGSLEVPSHLFALYQVAETILLFALAKDDETIIPERFSACQHGNLMNFCPKNVEKQKTCEGEDRLKYRQIRVCIDSIKIALCDEKSITDVRFESKCPTTFQIDVEPIRFTICNAHESRFTEHLAVRVPLLSIRMVIKEATETTQWLEVARTVVNGVSLDVELPLPDNGGHLEKARLEFVRKHDAATKRLHFLYSDQRVWECACFGKTRFFGDCDTLGEDFLAETNLHKRLFEPKINTTGQIGVHQSMLRAKEFVLRHESHMSYSIGRKNNIRSDEVIEVESQSFYSAVSHQKETRPSQCRSLMIAYTDYLTRCEVSKPVTEPPSLDKPGVLMKWANNKVVQVNEMRKGVNGLQIYAPGGVPLSSAEAVGARKNEMENVSCNRLGIHGSVADNIDIFVTPLAIEALERILNSISPTVNRLNPAFLIQHTYLSCVLCNHRQPLTESLFKATPKKLNFDILLDMPKMHMSFFQCGIADHFNGLSDLERSQAVSTNICLVLVDRATISTAKDNDTLGRLRLSMDCGVITAQLLHLVEKNDAEFLAANRPFKSKVNWSESVIGGRLDKKDLRVITDIHIPDVSIVYDDQRANNQNIDAKGEPLTTENKIKINFGTVRNIVVMARPLEKTGKHEFPLYDVLSPAITAWLNVLQRFDATIDRLISTTDYWSDMTFAKIMKLALESEEETILLAKTKNKMDAFKILGKHQTSCPSCLLLKVLMRWCALDESAPHLRNPLTTKSNFGNEKARKTALMALLSHWQPDICQMVKLASNSDAVRFREDAKKEVRINMDGVISETRHRRNGSAASRNLAKEGQQQQHRDRGEHSKLDLYSYIRSAHREWNERKDGKKTGSTLPQDYINPMDIIPQAFFYSFYKNRRLDWTHLDGVLNKLNKLKLSYEILTSELAIDLVEPKLLSSPAAEPNAKILAPCIHHLVSVRRVQLSGDFSWNIEMDEKDLMPIRGRGHLSYQGAVENIQFVLAIASVCLAKEVILVVKSASDTLADLKNSTSNPLTPVSMNSLVSAKSGNFELKTQTWDEKVFDMMKDFEKNVQRTGTIIRGDILKAVHGTILISDVCLESRLSDLYVSFDMKSIDVTQEHNPIPIHRSTVVPHEIDKLLVMLRKAKLTIRQSLAESSKTSESKPILNCTLKESTVNLNRKHLVIAGVAPTFDTLLSIALGAIDGELPMSAGSLHDVVMKHGPQLEMEFDRLSAQPAGLVWDQNEENLSTPTVNTAAWHREGPSLNLVRQKSTSPILKVQFKFKLESIELKAQILPSLSACYKLSHATGQGETGGKANWNALIKHHYAEFHVSPPDKPKDSFTLDLPSIDVNGVYLGEDIERKEARMDEKKTEKLLQYRRGGYLKMEVQLGRVNHSFTTELLNHILFVVQSFRTELHSLLTRIGPSSESTNSSVAAPSIQGNKRAEHVSQTIVPFLFHLTIKGVTKTAASAKEPWLQLTAATPTATAVRFTIDELQMELTNLVVVVDEAREKFVGRGLIQFSAKLGQLVKAVSYEETPAELQEYATFMTMIRVSNEESSQKTHSYHISLNRPYMMIKSSAIDKAILLWLNYKNTYDYWRAERTKFEKSLERKKRDSISQASVLFSPQVSQDFDINLSLSIVGGMYVCMPLISHDLTDGMPALVLSLQKSDVTVTIKKELACIAAFQGFKLTFINNFEDVVSTNYQHETNDSGSNFFFFPHGNYTLCSKASNESGDAKWVLSVRAHMRGMMIDLDQRIGKLAKMMVNTISSLGEEEQYDYFAHPDCRLDEDEELIDGANELASFPQTEQRVRWMEQKMHEQLRELSELTIRKADEKELEAARKKLRQYELLRFKEFRKTMVEKLKRGNEKTTSKRPSNASLQYPVAQKVSSSKSEDSERRREDVVNMHIDVQLNIESGSCTLRTSPKEQQAFLAKRPSAKDLRSKGILTTNTASFTKFSIPSVDLKGYYVSAAGSIPSPIGHSTLSSSSSSILTSLREIKHPSRGCFYLSVALASMPSETVVTPHLADFLEQMLDPLPLNTGARSITSLNTVGTEIADPVNNIVAIDTSALPLDVIFILSVQSSTIRFDGQQQRSSAADCLLKLPSLTLMGSTRRTDGSNYPGGIDISATLSAFSLSIYSPHQQMTAHDALSLTLDHLSFVISRSKNASIENDNKVRFVLTANIGTAKFNYDMRRLSELLAFPKPWFRKAIARRIFFGDQTGTQKTPDASKHSTIASNTAAPNTRSIPSLHEKPWSATVLLAVQWKELIVTAQMSNTMGTTSWITRKGLLRSLAKLDSRHQRDITLTFKLDGSDLTAHGGAISGEVSLSALSLSLNHLRNEKQAPKNRAHIQLGSFATRVEWMSRAVLIGRCDKPSIILGNDFPETIDKKTNEVLKVEVMLNVKGSWEDLQAVITRTTIDDFEKIINKLGLFFTEQLKNSRIAWNVFDDDTVSSLQPPVKRFEEKETEEGEPSKIRHWEKVLDLITEIQISLKLLTYPTHGVTVVGGSVELEAGRISIACMNGDMTSNSWALFNLRNPSILFSPEAQFYYVNRDSNTIGVSCRQRLIIRIGEVPVGTGGMVSAILEDRIENMANVCRVKAKGSVMRQNASIASCLDYLIGDILKESKLAPLTPTGPEQPKKSNHELLVLFHFPSLEAALTSLQNMECDPNEEVDPVVHSSFTADFYGAVHLNTDFNAQVQFLPDLITAYTKTSKPSSSMTTASDEIVEKNKDNRQYQCDTWHFAPSINFMEKGHAWKPPLVDDILKKLNVYDHRRTIPKVLQRALLDTLDAALANGILQMLKLVDRQEENKQL